MDDGVWWRLGEGRLCGVRGGGTSTAAQGARDLQNPGPKFEKFKHFSAGSLGVMGTSMAGHRKFHGATEGMRLVL
jgi:hypothetical protein